MSLSDEIKDLAGEIDPTSTRPHFRIVTDPTSEEIEDPATHDSDEVIRFTLYIDRRHDDEPA